MSIEQVEKINQKSSDDLKQGLWVFPISEKSPKIGWWRYYKDGILHGPSVWRLPADENRYSYYVEDKKEGEEIEETKI